MQLAVFIIHEDGEDFFFAVEGSEAKYPTQKELVHAYLSTTPIPDGTEYDLVEAKDEVTRQRLRKMVIDDGIEIKKMHDPELN